LAKPLRWPRLTMRCIRRQPKPGWRFGRSQRQCDDNPRQWTALGLQAQPDREGAALRRGRARSRCVRLEREGNALMGQNEITQVSQRRPKSSPTTAPGPLSGPNAAAGPLIVSTANPRYFTVE